MKDGFMALMNHAKWRVMDGPLTLHISRRLPVVAIVGRMVAELAELSGDIVKSLTTQISTAIPIMYMVLKFVCSINDKKERLKNEKISCVHHIIDLYRRCYRFGI